MIKELFCDKELLEKRSIEWDVRGSQDISIEICQDLEDTLAAHPELVYLCANEIGHPERAIDVRFADDTYLFYNPLFKHVDKMQLCREIDRHNGKEYIVPRFSEIELIYQDTLGGVKANKIVGPAAIVICQAMDTMDGLFASDIGLEVLPEFDKASEEEKIQVLTAYMDSFKSSYEKLDKELSTNTSTAQLWKAAKFIEASNKGEVEFEKEEDKPLSKRKQRFFTRMAKKFKQNENRLKFWRKK